MIVDSKAVIAMQNLIGQRDFMRLSSWEVKGFTLGAALELACARKRFQKEQDTEALAILMGWSQRQPVLEEAASALRHRGIRPVSNEVIHGQPPPLEICSAPLEEQMKDYQWRMFQDRFSRSLKANGFGPSLAKALSKAMEEMTDNVIQHSGVDKYHQANGVIGFHTASRCMTFAVADVGRGVLESLKTNPKWQMLHNSADALAASVHQSATSRLEETRGEGFRVVLNALADLNGHLRFRSGSGSFILDGRGEHREAIKGYVPEMGGFQLSVTCSLDENECNMTI